MFELRSFNLGRTTKLMTRQKYFWSWVLCYICSLAKSRFIMTTKVILFSMLHTEYYNCFLGGSTWQFIGDCIDANMITKWFIQEWYEIIIIIPVVKDRWWIQASTSYHNRLIDALKVTNQVQSQFLHQQHWKLESLEDQCSCLPIFLSDQGKDLLLLFQLQQKNNFKRPSVCKQDRY